MVKKLGWLSLLLCFGAAASAQDAAFRRTQGPNDGQLTGVLTGLYANSSATWLEHGAWPTSSSGDDDYRTVLHVSDDMEISNQDVAESYVADFGVTAQSHLDATNAAEIAVDGQPTTNLVGDMSFDWGAEVSWELSQWEGDPCYGEGGDVLSYGYANFYGTNRIYSGSYSDTYVQPATPPSQHEWEIYSPGETLTSEDTVTVHGSCSVGWALPEGLSEHSGAILYSVWVVSTPTGQPMAMTVFYNGNTGGDPTGFVSTGWRDEEGDWNISNEVLSEDMDIRNVEFYFDANIGSTVRVGHFSMLWYGGYLAGGYEEGEETTYELALRSGHVTVEYDQTILP